ncbi:MAG TPA: FMN-binding protein [Candidatus Saccharimonadales bacterium]|nr:FMN-binding protein [Candidatus Saccharimonadales bacterium]
MKPTKQLHPAITALIVIVLIGAIAASIAFLRNEDEAPASDTNSSQPAQTSSPKQDTQTTTAEYQDGTYTATGEYFSPGGRESITVSVTLDNGEITESTVTPHAESGEAKDFQERFASGYKEFVTGKNIDEVSVSRVAGSSLTSGGFNDALEQIKDDAAA